MSDFSLTLVLRFKTRQAKSSMTWQRFRRKFTDLFSITSIIMQFFIILGYLFLLFLLPKALF